MINEPWQITPQLEKVKLQLIAALLVQVRGEVIERHEPEIGDTRLSLGLRAYECCRSRIILKDKNGDWSWLSILTDQGKFTFAIGGIPVRFCRNSPDNLPDRKLIPSGEGFDQMRLFEDKNPYAHLVWFLIIDTPYDQPVEQAYFVGYNEFNDIVCKWEIPLTDSIPMVSEVKSNKPAAVEVPPAKAKLKLVTKKSKSDE